MTKIAGVVAAAVAIVSVTLLGEATVQPWLGDDAYARTSTECYHKCKVYNWSALHCLRRCRGRWHRQSSSPGAIGRSKALVESLPATPLLTVCSQARNTERSPQRTARTHLKAPPISVCQSHFASRDDWRSTRLKSRSDAFSVPQPWRDRGGPRRARGGAAANARAELGLDHQHRPWRRLASKVACRMLDQPYVLEKPGNSTLGQEHVEISGRALPEIVGMLFKERTCGLPPLRTEHQ